MEDTDDDLGTIPPDQTTDCVTMEVEIFGEEIEVVIDTGAAISLITKDYLESTGRTIEEASNVDLTDANGRKKRALGRVKNVEVTVEGRRLVKMDMEVTEATNYDVILGNDWLVKNKAEIKPAEETITLGAHGQRQDYWIKVFKDIYKYKIPENDDYEEQEIIERTVFHTEGEDFEWIYETRDFEFEGMEEINPFLDEEQMEQLDNLLWDYQGIFAEDLCDLGRTDQEEHTINTGENYPVHIIRRNYAEKDKEFMKEEVERMLEAGVIQHSKSAWSSPPVIVPKKGGKKRFCIDYRKLNQITEKDKYPLPKIEDILTKFNGAKYYTTLDLASGYWQIQIKEEDRKKTAFTTENGFYEFVKMPFGLTNAPATFQRTMDLIFREEIGDFIQVYLDDIIIYSQTWEEHIEHIEEVFQKLHEAGLKLGRDKCDFAKEEIEFLGHVITQEGIKADPKKIQVAKDWETPQTVKQIRSFVGFMSYYRKFIKDFSTIAKPMTLLTQKDQEFNWGEKQQKAFDQLKQILIEEIVLTHPDMDKPFIVSTDASGEGLGAIISQEDENGNVRPIEFASKTLVGAEGNYSATELELLAVKWAVTRKFNKYLLGGQQFKLITDHQALVSILNNKKEVKTNSKRMQKWIIELEGYNMTVEYNPGKHQTNVDELSRMFSNGRHSSTRPESLKTTICKTKLD